MIFKEDYMTVKNIQFISFYIELIINEANRDRSNISLIRD